MDYEVLQKEHEEVKKRLDACKARNKSQSAEMKTLKVQISTLLDKGKHDNELVDALLVGHLEEKKMFFKNYQSKQALCCIEGLFKNIFVMSFTSDRNSKHRCRRF